MKRCTACFRYSLGEPTFCNHCGRSYDVRICHRGHRNARGVRFCAECGSAELSTPAPPAGVLFTISLWVLRVVGLFVLVLAALVGIVGALSALPWSAIGPHLLSLAVVLGLLYWSTTLLPGPIKKVGKAAGKAAWKSISPRRKDK